MFYLFFYCCVQYAKKTTPVKTSTETKTAPDIKTVSEKTAAEKIAPEKTAKQKTTTMKARHEINLSIDNMHINHHIKARHVINLSVDNIHIDHHIKNNNFLNTGKEPIEINNALFETLSKNDIESGINLTGKLLTDKDKVKNKQYLESVNGVQIIIKGNFN